jgi:hypothetical protein
MRQRLLQETSSQKCPKPWDREKIGETEFLESSTFLNTLPCSTVDIHRISKGVFPSSSVSKSTWSKQTTIIRQWAVQISTYILLVLCLAYLSALKMGTVSSPRNVSKLLPDSKTSHLRTEYSPNKNFNTTNKTAYSSLLFLWNNKKHHCVFKSEWCTTFSEIIKATKKNTEVLLVPRKRADTELSDECY